MESAHSARHSGLSGPFLEMLYFADPKLGTLSFTEMRLLPPAIRLSCEGTYILLKRYVQDLEEHSIYVDSLR